MKRASSTHKKGLLFLVVLVAMVAVLVPGVLAAPAAGVWYSDGDWSSACGILGRALR